MCSKPWFPHKDGMCRKPWFPHLDTPSNTRNNNPCIKITTIRQQ